MSMCLQVSLISGRTVSLEIEVDAEVDTLKHRAQSALVVGRGRLLTSSGNVLRGAATLQQSELQGGDALTLHVRPVQVSASRLGSAFAAVLGDGAVVTCGPPASGGDSSRVRDCLQDVQQVQATRGAFAAITSDGSVVTWGDEHAGGDSSAMQARLRRVQQIQASSQAFAALLDDGSVVTWGNPAFGGDSQLV